MKHLYKILILIVSAFALVNACAVSSTVGVCSAVGSLQLPTPNEVKSKTFIYMECQVANLTQPPPQSNIADSTIVLDAATGLIVAEGLDLVTAHCTGCHSSKLITQFHTDRQGWLEKVRLMQQKHKLWDLGEAEPVILDYLAKNYPPTEKVNRRAALKNVDWYKLK